MKDAYKWVTVLALTLACGACTGTENASSDPSSEGSIDSAAAHTGSKWQQALPVYREVTIPAGTTLRLNLASSIASDTSHVEDAVRATVRDAVVVDGARIVPTGAALAGVVTDVAGAGRVKGRARIAYRFDSLTVGDERYDIATAPTSHLAPATKAQDAKKIGIGAGAGAAVGALLGGGSGAIKGAAIGGAGGTGVVLATKGKEVRLGPGANVTTKLTAPVIVRVKV